MAVSEASRQKQIPSSQSAREDWDTRFSKRDLTSADLSEISISGIPGEVTVLSLSAHAFTTAFGLEKSNDELRKQFILSGSVQLNGEKLTDPFLAITPKPGDVLKLSKKHAVKLI